MSETDRNLSYYQFVSDQKIFLDQIFLLHQNFLLAKIISDNFFFKLRDLDNLQMAKPTHIYQIKPIKPNIPNETFKLGLPNHSYETYSSKPNLPDQTKISKGTKAKRQN